jgi:hypothetical protein
MYNRCYATIIESEVISDPLLGNDLVNTFPRQRLRMQWRKCDGVCMVRTEEL